ncbi:hypothetical protein AOQ84DRAFT_281168, partial [Glonium stellatum]
YSTEIVSIDPLIIYINNFTSQEEAEGLVKAAEGRFRTSEVYLHGRKQHTSDRTSQSAGLPLDNPYVTCVLTRARSFLGTMLLPSENFGMPQLVHYKAKQRFDLHHDWYDSPQLLPDGSGRRFNRVASFFVFLQDNCTKGETYFPYVTALDKKTIGDGRKIRAYEDGGVVFKPISGNAIFWVNLFPNGTGDTRVMHAGLPLGKGTKTAMNIWPRKIYH